MATAITTNNTAFRVTHSGDHFFYIEQGAFTLARITPGWLKYAAPNVNDAEHIKRLLIAAFAETFGDASVAALSFNERKNLQSLALVKFTRFARGLAVPPAYLAARENTFATAKG